VHLRETRLKVLVATGVATTALAAGCGGGGGTSDTTPTMPGREVAGEHSSLRPKVEAAKQRLEEHGTVDPKSVLKEARSEAARQIRKAEREAGKKLRSIERRVDGSDGPSG
jgi:hypothetical protein